MKVQIDNEVRDATPEEIAAYEIQSNRPSLNNLLEMQRSASQAAIAHAKSLGFTDEMIAVMYPNLTGAGDATE